MNTNRINLYIGIFKNSWKLLWKNFRVLIPIIIPIFLGSIAPKLLFELAATLGYNMDPNSENMSLLIYLIIAFSIIIQSVITMGFSRCATLLINGEKPTASVFYNINDCIKEGLKALFITYILIFAGLLLLVIPGIYFALQYHFVLYFVALKGLKTRLTIWTTERNIKTSDLKSQLYLSLFFCNTDGIAMYLLSEQMAW